VQITNRRKRKSSYARFRQLPARAPRIGQNYFCFGNNTKPFRLKKKQSSRHGKHDSFSDAVSVVVNVVTERIKTKQGIGVAVQYYVTFLHSCVVSLHMSARSLPVPRPRGSVFRDAFPLRSLRLGMALAHHV
jgi:hypothetical protein